MNFSIFSAHLQWLFCSPKNALSEGPEVPAR